MMTLVSSETVIEFIVASEFAHVGHYAFSAEPNPRHAYALYLRQNVLFGVANQANSALLRLKTQMIPRLDSKGLAYLYRDCDLTLAGNLGSDWLLHCGFLEGRHLELLLTFSMILLT
jgi:hypothetical protein